MSIMYKHLLKMIFYPFLFSQIKRVSHKFSVLYNTVILFFKSFTLNVDKFLLSFEEDSYNLNSDSKETVRKIHYIWWYIRAFKNTNQILYTASD